MGKKSRKKTSGGAKATATSAAVSAASESGAAAAADERSYKFKNPDGSKSMVITGELAYIGGRTLHIGGAAMPLGSEPYSHDPLVQSRNSALYSRTAIGERQAVSMKELHSAFHRKYGEEGSGESVIDPMTEACLALEKTIGIMGYDAKVKNNDGRMRGNFFQGRN